jgi:hypothetical protein
MSHAHLLVLAACIAGGLALTLVLASFLTPRSWWRRANARALAVVVGGTAVFGGLFMLSAGVWQHHAAPDDAPLTLAAPVPIPAPLPSVRRTVQDYRVFDDLNLRAASGTGAARMAVVPGGTLVTTTGRVDGDWWEVTARVHGRQVTGWASSLWLRRGDEIKPGG